MLKNYHVLIVGGDARYLEVINHLADCGATVEAAGFEQVTFQQSEVHHTRLQKVDFRTIDAMLLPVSGTDSKGKIDAPYALDEIYLTQNMIAQTPDHCCICTGISNAFLNKATDTVNRKLVRLFSRDDIAIYNSIPTAEGALMLAMEETNVTIHGSHVMVFGFGRIGMTVARLFSAVGAQVHVCVRKAADIARIMEMGMQPVLIKDLAKEITDTDIYINTVPRQIVDHNIISAMKKSSLIIDLASSPGGTDFTFADQQGIKNVHALGLPGKVAPKTAGKIIADVFTKVIFE